MRPAVSRQCLQRALFKRLPVLSWLPRYTLEDAAADLVAGITVGLTLMPQAIAYASLAGLQSQYGLYSAFAGSFVYILLGTCKEVNIGPTALISLLTSSYTHGSNPDMAVLLCFLSGCVELLCGVLQLGFLVEFVSVPVVAGFTSAAALIIACSQIKGLLGLKFNAEDFLDTWIQLKENIHKYNPGDVILGVCCIILLLSLRKLKDVKIATDEDKPTAGRRKVLQKTLWFISTGRNAMVVVICAVIAYIFKRTGEVPFALAAILLLDNGYSRNMGLNVFVRFSAFYQGNIVPGLPPVGLPPFSTSFGNQTYSFTEMCSYLSSGIAVVPIISILGNVAIAKAFSSGAMLDATQEMITLGVANIVGSFFRSMPVTGSFSRSAVNNASGVRTQMGGLYTGILVILALSLLTPYFYFIPKATLSSVIICAVIFMVEVGIVVPMWRSNKRDLLPAFATFIACLCFGVEIGIVIGIAVDIAFLLYFNARPRVVVEKVVCPTGLEYILVTPSAGLLFPAVDFVREAVAKASNLEEQSGIRLAVVVNCKHMHRADFTAAQGIQALIQDFNKRERHVIFHSLKPDVARILKGVCPPEFVYSTTEAGLIQILKGLQAGMERNEPEHIKLEVNYSSEMEPVLHDTHF